MLLKFELNARCRGVLSHEDEALRSAAFALPILLGIDVAQGCDERDALAFEIGERVGKSVRARPAHIGEWLQHVRYSPQPHEPVAAVRRFAEHRIGAAEKPEGFCHMARTKLRNVAADDDRRSWRHLRKETLHAPAEIAFSLRHSTNPPPSPRGAVAVRRDGNRRLPALVLG